MAPSAIDIEPVSSAPYYDPSKDTFRGPSKVQFNPETHLAYEPSSHRYTFTELGLPILGTSDFATTEPFQLCTEAAVIELRRELLQESSVKKRLHWWHRAPGCLRGFTVEEAPFVHAFWNSPEVLKIVSDEAGLELEPCLPYEIGHTNIQIGPGGREAVKDVPLLPTPHTTASTSWPVCSHISGPVLVSCANGLAGLANWLT